MSPCTEQSDTMSESVLCAECGWSGERSELELVDGERQCPVCTEGVEFVE